MVGKCFKGLTDELLTWQTKQLLARETGRRGIAVLVRPELVVEIALDGVQSWCTPAASRSGLHGRGLGRTRTPARPTHDRRPARLLPARAGDEFQASGPSKEVPDERIREER